MSDSAPSPDETAYCDAHNHLQDERFAGRQAELMATARLAGISRMAVNGSGEEDWVHVAALAREFPEVLPSFGCHPWHLRSRTPQWLTTLRAWLDDFPEAGVGEIGLDRWMLENPSRWRTYVGLAETENPPSLAEQESAFLTQLRLAAEGNRAVSIHCLQAFGRLRDLLTEHPRPARGFLLHSYGGPAEMIPVFAKLGGYFSFPGYFAQERKARQRDVFRRVPADRLLIETDAPDQLPPAPLQRYSCPTPGASPLNHPANLAAIYEFVADLVGMRLDPLRRMVAANFRRLFGENPPAARLSQ